MAAPYNPPVKNEDFIFEITLTDANDGRKLKTDPTIAAGDFKIYKDSGAPANLATLPVVAQSGYPVVRVELSSTEMNADRVMIVWQDQTNPPEWIPASFCILTTQ